MSQMTMNQTKVLLLGVGRWGANHLRVLHSLPIELFVTDLDPKKLAPARKLGIADSHLATDPRLFAERIDAAVVVTPAQAHFATCCDLLNAGKDVFVEKPITLEPPAARKLAELADRRKRILQVGHIFRFDPASQWLHEAIQLGKFGRVKILRGNFSGFKRPRQDTGVTFADSIHFIDLFNYFMGRSPTRVTSMLQDFMGRGMDDESLITMDYDGQQGKTWATVESGYFTPGKFREVIVIGEKLSAVCDYNVAQYKIKTFQNQHIRKGTTIQTQEGAMHQLEFPPEEPLRAELCAFLDSVQSRKAPLADGWAGYESVRVIEAAMKSAKLGKTVTLSHSR